MIKPNSILTETSLEHNLTMVKGTVLYYSAVSPLANLVWACLNSQHSKWKIQNSYGKIYSNLEKYVSVFYGMLSYRLVENITHSL